MLVEGSADRDMEICFQIYFHTTILKKGKKGRVSNRLENPDRFFNMIMPIGICMGCLTCPASQLPGPLSTPVVDAAATRGVQGSQDGLSSPAWPHPGLHRVGEAEITSAGARLWGQVKQGMPRAGCHF